MVVCKRCHQIFKKKGKYQEICENCNKAPSWLSRLKITPQKIKHGKYSYKKISSIKKPLKRIFNER